MSGSRSTEDLRYNATLLDILLLVPHAFGIAYAVLHRLVTRPFSSRPKASTLLKDLFFTAVRQHSGNVSVAQEALITISTQGGYRQYMKSQGVPPRIDVLDSGLEVLWYGPKTSKKTLLFFHGGGYAMACSLGHFRWFDKLQKDLSAKHDVSIATPAYELTLDKPAPKGRFPAQLKQGSEALAWLINVQGRRPSDIIVAGDSAGGHLTITLLSHLLHPHPAATKIDLKEPLAGAVLVSPWTNLFPADTPQARYNETSDMIVIGAGRRWSALFLGGQERNSFNNPAEADPKWFVGLESKVKDILIWGGGVEAIINTIIKFNDILQAAHPRVEFVIQDGASHDDFVLEAMLGYKHKHEGTKVIETWIDQRL